MENQNDILKRLIAESEIEKAPINFADEVMKKINTHAETRSVVNFGGFLSPQYWLLIGAALGIALIVVFSFDMPAISWLLENGDIPNMGKIFSKYLIQIQNFVSQLEISSVSFAIITGITLLIAIDRLLKKRFAFHLFSF